MTNTYIYALVDPRTDLIRYIGKSDNPQVRLKQHISRFDKTYKSYWVKELLQLGLQPELRILEECAPEHWQEAERSWISLGRAVWPLTNHSEGGLGGGKRSPEGILRARQALLGNQRTKGLKHTPETRKRMSASHTGKKLAAKTVLKLREKLSGLKRKNRTSNYIGVDKKAGRWRARIGDIHIGLFDTEEEAAHAHDAYVQKHGITRPLNFPLKVRVSQE